eukprot:s56_g22.t1
MYSKLQTLCTSRNSDSVGSDSVVIILGSVLWPQALVLWILYGKGLQCIRACMCLRSLPQNSSQVVSNCDGVRTGEVCHQVCAPGYVNTTAEVDYVCHSDGFASHDHELQCQPIPCDTSATLDLASFSCAGVSFGSSCFASCTDGYYAAAERWTCGDDSSGLPRLAGFSETSGVSLRGAMPDCEALPCVYNLPVGSQYAHNCSGVTTGGSCLVACGPEFEGPSEVLTCGTDRAFNGTFPLCLFVTSTATSTRSTTYSTTVSTSFTLEITSTTLTRTSTTVQTTLALDVACPEGALPALEGTGQFNCSGESAVGQERECRAPCDHIAPGYPEEARVLCRYDFEWETIQECPRLVAANVPIILYVGITVGSCCCCVIVLAVLAYHARRKPAAVSPDVIARSTSSKIADSPAHTKKAFEAPDWETEPVEERADKDIQQWAAGLSGTAEPEASIIVASPTAHEYDPEFWDWANQFWDWANQIQSFGRRITGGGVQSQLPPPPPPLPPSTASESQLRSIAVPTSSACLASVFVRRSRRTLL